MRLSVWLNWSPLTGASRKGEVVIELQRRADHIGVELALPVVAGLRPIAGQAEAARGAAVGRIERTVTIDQALVDRALRDLVGRVPAIGIGHRRQREAVGRGAVAVAQHAVELADIVRHVPGTVVFVGLEGREQRSIAGLGRASCHRTLIAEAADGQLDDVLRQSIQIVDVDRAGGSKVALVRVVGTLADVHRPDQLRDRKLMSA
ncbi:hypothetical protein ABIF30_002175 [Bradyrhizobium elkanii]